MNHGPSQVTQNDASRETCEETGFDINYVLRHGMYCVKKMIWDIPKMGVVNATRVMHAKVCLMTFPSILQLGRRFRMCNGHNCKI